MKVKSQESKVKSFLFIAILILYSSVLASEWKTYTNTNFVNDIVADSNHIYCATRGGLTIFSKRDSIFTDIYTNVHGLPSNRVNCLLFDTHEQLWVGTNRGLAIYNPHLKSLTRYHDLGSVEQNYINCLASSGDTILVGTQNGLIVIDTRGTGTISDDRIISRMLPTQVSCRVFALGVHDDFWISACPGLVRLNRDLQNFSVMLHPFGDSVKAMTVVNDSLYIASEQGIGRYNGIVFETVVLFAERYPVFDLKYFNDKFYVATTSGLLQFDGSNLWFILYEDTRAILNADGLWVGLGGWVWFGSGLKLNQNNDWQSFLTNSIAANIVSCAITDKDGNIYAMHYPVSYKAISKKLIDDQWQFIYDTIANSYVGLVDQNKCVWFGHWLLNGGLSCYDPTNQVWSAQTWTGLKGVVGAMGIDNNDVIWFHNQNNTIIAYAQDSIYEFTIPGLSRPEKHGYEIVFDKDNQGWLCWSGGLVRFKYDNLSNLSTQIFAYHEVISAAVDAKNNIWCATDQGATVVERDTFRIYNTANSQILSNRINRIKADDWGGVWILSSQGLSRYDIFTKQWGHYTANNSGIIANEDNDDKFYQWLFIDQANGFLLVATKEGISQFHYRITPPSVLSQIRAYPNPFIKSQHSAITFDSLPADAKISIYNLVGELICELTPNTNFPGARWTPSNMPSGVYLALIVADGKRQVVKFAIIN
ncbi:MAG: T9SS type A sorting domain-containing protein [Candidatus Latescibacteria bacterium]|nr:T9SS type A sorting domain-containing protein [Candidatus Latescibacterota bacterium]